MNNTIRKTGKKAVQVASDVGHAALTGLVVGTFIGVTILGVRAITGTKD